MENVPRGTKSWYHTCPFKMEASFNFCLSNCSLCLFLVIVSRKSDIVIHAFHKVFCKKYNILAYKMGRDLVYQSA